MHPPVEEYAELFCPVGSEAVGGSGGPWQCKLLTCHSPVAHGPIPDTIYHSAKFCLHLLDTGQILGLTF